MRDLADHVHRQGQQLGIDDVPGIADDLLRLDPPILGTTRHIREIVFTPRQQANHWGGHAVDFAWAAGRGGGWNDLDALLVGNGAMIGLTFDERRSAMTLRAIACSPLYSGDDLTRLDPAGLELLTNDEVIAVNPAGRVARPVGAAEGQAPQVWASRQDDGGLVVALFNLDGKSAREVAVPLADLGWSGSARLRDLWTHQDAGTNTERIEANLAPHACRLFRLAPIPVGGDPPRGRGEATGAAGPINPAPPRPWLAEGREGVVVGLSGRRAVHAGLEVLQQGGSATDAALATALVQVVEAGGSYVSFAGILSLTHYDAATGRVEFLNAGFNTPLDEADPLSIPRFDPATLKGTPSGRTALVPGFMAGVAATHGRFGTLPFARLFEPAIALAEDGFPIDPLFAGFLDLRRDVLGRLPETRRLFTKPDGSPYGLGNPFRQPELAATLRRAATDGPAFLTTGDWGRRFVAAVRRDGGVLTARDLEAYRPTWESPLETTYGATSVFAPGFSSTGGVDAIEALNLLELAGLRRVGPPTRSAESLFRLAQIADNQGFATDPARAARRFPGRDFSPQARVTKEHARRVWERMREGTWPDAPGPAAAQGRPGHSSGVVAVDRRGNVAALTHTSNTAVWGNTGLFVGGISIPDSASFQQEAIRDAGPGKRLADPMCPMIATRAGKPILATSAIGGGLHQRNIQAYANILEFGMDAQAAVDAPAFLLPERAADRPVVRVGAGSFDPAILAGLAALGQPSRVVPPEERGMLVGYWIGVQLDPDSGRLRAAGTAEIPSYAEGY